MTHCAYPPCDGLVAGASIIQGRHRSGTSEPLVLPDRSAEAVPDAACATFHHYGLSSRIQRLSLQWRFG